MMKHNNFIAVLICFGLRFAHAFAPPFSRSHAAPRSVVYVKSREAVLTKRLLLGRRNEEVLKTEKDCGQKAFVLSSDIDKTGSENLVDVEPKTLLPVILITGLGLIAATFIYVGSLGDMTNQIVKIQSIISDPQSTLEGVVEHVEEMGPMGFVYFGAIYTIAEILAIPAVPLTASAGYLFGVQDGTAVVLFSASIAAAVSFLIGRTFLRSYVEGILEDYPDFQRIDKAIESEGFKLMLLLRLSPIFPFALSNYLYGVTSIKFWPYFWGTMLGFLPGTVAYVYTGEIGKSLTLDSASAEPWYIYVGGLALLCGFIKIASDVASGIIEKAQLEHD